MNSGIIVRITTYHGEPVAVDGIPFRASYRHDEPIADGDVVNVPCDSADGGLATALLRIIEAFEEEYRCKVNFDETVPIGSTSVVEFDVFEPAWPACADAIDVIDDLTMRIVVWVRGQANEPG